MPNYATKLQHSRQFRSKIIQSQCLLPTIPKKKQKSGCVRWVSAYLTGLTFHKSSILTSLQEVLQSQIWDLLQDKRWKRKFAASSTLRDLKPFRRCCLNLRKPCIMLIFLSYTRFVEADEKCLLRNIETVQTQHPAASILFRFCVAIGRHSLDREVSYSAKATVCDQAKHSLANGMTAQHPRSQEFVV